MQPRHRARRTVVAALLALGLAACGDPVEVVEPASLDDGLQATGTLDGQRIAISRGFPIVTLGDCDPVDGRDDDLCILARTIDGLEITFVVENPAVLVTGTVLSITDSSCFAACDDERDAVVMDVRYGEEDRRATGGTLELTQAGPRYAGALDVTLPFGDRLIATFDVLPQD